MDEKNNILILYEDSGTLEIVKTLPLGTKIVVLSNNGNEQLFKLAQYCYNLGRHYKKKADELT